MAKAKPQTVIDKIIEGVEEVFHGHDQSKQDEATSQPSDDQMSEHIKFDKFKKGAVDHD